MVEHKSGLYDVIIIGAGPAGCYAAYLLAKKGRDVSIFEEHSKIGLPVQCTGITTAQLKNIIELDRKFIINKIDTARIFSRIPPPSMLR